MLSRRAFMLSAAAASTALPTLARSQPAPAGPGGGDQPAVLRLQRRTIEVNGKPASVYGIRQPDGTFGIRTEVGKRFRVRVENRIDEPSLIHWHGLTPPWQQDGVPGVSGPPIPPGGSADYDFPLRFGGTFWMHSHQGLQEQLLMAAPLIIRDQRDRADQQEVVVMLADFSFTPPEQIFAELKKGGTMPSMTGHAGRRRFGERRMATRPAAWRDAGGHGHGRQAGSERRQIRRVPGQRPHARRSRGGQGRAGRARAAARHQQLVDERLSRRSRRARRRADRRRRLPGRAGQGHAASRSRWRSGSTSGSRFRARPRRIPCSRCSKARASQTGIVLRAGRGAGRAHSRHGRHGFAGAHARSGAPPARRQAAQAAQGRPRPHPRT